jgi:diguanylate cyclase (GGDEF)-like protein
MDRRTRVPATNPMIHTLPGTRPAEQGEREGVRDPAEDVATALGVLLMAWGDRARVPLSLKEAGSGRYVWVNGAMAALLGRSADAVAGHSDAEWLPAAQYATLRAAEQAAARQSEGALSEHRVDFPAGRRDFSVMRVPVAATSGEPPLVASVWTDLGQAREREAQLALALEQLEAQQLANAQLRREVEDRGLRDQATGLCNSAHFDDVLRREIDLSAREHREFALVLVELDTPAHASAEDQAVRSRMLEALGRHLRANTRAMDASCRLGDDRFAVLLSGVGLATAHSRMEGLRRECARQIVAVDGRGLGFTISMGVASFPHTADTRDTLIVAADSALREAIRRGGNHVSLASIRFDPEPSRF